MIFDHIQRPFSGANADLERYLLEKIAAIQEEARLKMAPYLKELERLEALRPPPIITMAPENDADRARLAAMVPRSAFGAAGIDEVRSPPPAEPEGA